MCPLQCIAVIYAVVAIAQAGGVAPAASGRIEVSVVAHASPTRVTVGDRILYTLGVAVPKGTSVTFPSVGQLLGDFRVRDLGRSSSAGSKNERDEFTQVYEMRVYKTGERFIPSMTVALKNMQGETQRIETGEIAVRVESVLDKEAKDIKDIKPPLALAYAPGLFFLWIALGGAAVAAAIVWVRRRKSGKTVLQPPPPPPHVIAYEELKRILAMNLVAKGRVKEYYIRISGVVRLYIEGRFGLRAPERTTEEFLDEASRSGLLDARARTLVGDFLESCDMVKFARYGPSAGEIDEAYKSARRFVDETKELN